jgi:hypothetical protein
MAPRFKLFRKFVEIFAAQWAPPVLLTPMTNRKIFIQKSFHYFVRTPLESRVKLKIIFFLQVHFKVKKNLKQNSRDTVPLKVLSNDRGGGMSGINRQAFPSSTSPQIFGKQIEWSFIFSTSKNDFERLNNSLWSILKSRGVRSKIIE